MLPTFSAPISHIFRPHFRGGRKMWEISKILAESEMAYNLLSLVLALGVVGNKAYFFHHLHGFPEIVLPPFEVLLIAVYNGYL